MYPEILEENIEKCKRATSKPFGVNVPLLYPDIEKIMEIISRQDVPVVFTSAGNPTIWTSYLKERGRTVVHVVSSAKFALKAEAAGVDAVVAEGFEAGGHNGREETTTFVLLPIVKEAVKIPLIAAGGLASGKAMLAAEVLGADGFQIGSLFAASQESSAHQNFKNLVVDAKEGDTILTLKQITPVRLIKNPFYEQILKAESNHATIEELKNLLGRGRAKRGIFDGDLTEGELEIGQVAAMINAIKPASEIVTNIWTEYLNAKKEICQ
jgi:enoyl-[acyl-carrier protein] reductase II